MKMAQNSSNGLKTLWEKVKLLVMSNFFFSHSVFKRLVLETHKNQGLLGKALNELKTVDGNYINYECVGAKLVPVSKLYT